jgi:DNA modification methylase
MEISSNRGDTVFDGFAGVFTTARVAKSLGRKFIGIEQDKTFFDAAVRRLA